MVGQDKLRRPGRRSRRRASRSRSRRRSPTSDADGVVRDRPLAGRDRRRRHHGDACSSPTAPRRCPDVVGMTAGGGEARDPQRRASSRRVIENADTTEPPGTVISQSPEAGETPTRGSTVTIVVSTFVEPTETPDRRAPTEPTDATTRPTDAAAGAAGAAQLPGRGRAATAKFRSSRPSYAGAMTSSSSVELPADARSRGPRRRRGRPRRSRRPRARSSSSPWSPTAWMT